MTDPDWRCSVPCARRVEQRILNEHPVPPRSVPTDALMPIPMTVRIVWEVSCQARIDTESVGGARNLVPVTVAYPRNPTEVAWAGVRSAARRLRLRLSLQTYLTETTKTLAIFRSTRV